MKIWLARENVDISTIGYFSSLNPKESLGLLAGICVLVAFFGATQDVAIDAFIREYLNDAELALGSGVTQYGFRIAMLLSGGLGVSLVGSDFINLTWNELYYVLAAVTVPISGNG